MRYASSAKVVSDVDVQTVSQHTHIYNCHMSYLASQPSRRFTAPFAEFCFLCPEGHWSTSQDDWKRHCESYLSNLDTLPYQCYPLI